MASSQSFSTDPAADVAFALAGVAGKQRRAVVHLRNAAAGRGAVLHLGQHIREKEHLPVVRTCDEAVFRIARMLDHEAGIAHAGLAAHALLIALPAFAVGRIGKHEVELHRGERVVRKRGVFRAADDVVGILAFAFQQHVGFADGIGLGIDFLAVKVRDDLLLVSVGLLAKRFFGHG